MKSSTLKRCLPLFATFATVTALVVCGGPTTREILLGVSLVATLGLIVAALPMVAFALLLRVIRTPPLDTPPEIRLVPRGEPTEVGAGALERHRATI